MIEWHRIFGLLLDYFFRGSPFDVVVELDLSKMQQRLDVVVVRRRKGPMNKTPPDGLENLSDHNLISFKSLRQPLDDWALKELTGHFVNYRKQISPSLDQLLPEERFRMYGVCWRYPQKLAGEVDLRPIQPGVYEVDRGTDRIRVIVTSQIPSGAHNYLWHLLSGDPDLVSQAMDLLGEESRSFSSVLNELLSHYNLEGIHMPYTMEDFTRDYVKGHLDVLTSEERLEGLPPEELVKRLPPEERVKGLTLEERLKGLPPEEQKALLEELQRKFKQENGGTAST